MKRMLYGLVLVAGMLMASGCCCGGQMGGCDWFGGGSSAMPCGPQPAQYCP